MLLDSAKPPTYHRGLPWGFGINDPGGGLTGEMAERAVVDTIRWWEETQGRSARSSPLPVRYGPCALCQLICWQGGTWLGFEEGELRQRLSSEVGQSSALAGGETFRNHLDVLVCFWFCPHQYSHFLGKWSIDLCKGGGQGERQEALLLAVGKEEAGQVPQTRSWQSEMCLKRRKKIKLGRLRACTGVFSLLSCLSPDGGG